jgi:hypothetical protein
VERVERGDEPRVSNLIPLEEFKHETPPATESILESKRDNNLSIENIDCHQTKELDDSLSNCLSFNHNRVNKKLDEKLTEKEINLNNEDLELDLSSFEWVANSDGFVSNSFH